MRFFVCAQTPPAQSSCQPTLCPSLPPPPQPSLFKAARECNDALLELRPSEEAAAGGGGGGGGGRVDTAAVLAVVGREVGRGGGSGGGDDDASGGGGAARIEALRWIEFLLAR